MAAKSPHPWPVQHVVVDERDLITVPWLLALQNAGKTAEDGGGAAAGRGPYTRTLLLKDTQVGVDIADHTTVYADGVGVRMVGVLRVLISMDLTVSLSKSGEVIMQMTIPAATLIDDPVESTAWLEPPGPNVPFVDGQVLTWNVVSSDASAHKHGIASFTVEWAPVVAGSTTTVRRLRNR